MPESSPSPGTVFLSYASQDAAAAARICESLRTVGVEVWLDQSALRGGDAWDAQIKKQIHECALFIPVISAHTNARTEGYFRREWNLAARRLLDMAHDSAFLVPVAIDETREADARVPEEFLRAHWTRLPGGETPAAFAHRVRQLLETRDTAAGSSETHSQPGVSPIRGADYERVRKTRRVRLGAITTAAVVALFAFGWAVREWGARDDARPSDELPLATTELPARSVAVLAFENRGGSEGSGVLAEGIPETVLHQLGLLPGLTVIARGSSFAFRDAGEDLRVIGRKLNVRYLLEGSIQAAGNRLRVTSRLVDAQTGVSVWSEQFEPKLEDLFAVQDEIALAVARALKLTLDAASDRATGTRAGATTNYDAYF
ncbi:MAG: TIR domain-containing protein, partial [Pseudomonadota bacterium]|nr:TIR domain-containing protein [Pseudomonadota bacterium]